MKYLIALFAICLVSQSAINAGTVLTKKERCEKKAVIVCANVDPELSDRELKECHKTETVKCMKKMEAEYK